MLHEHGSNVTNLRSKLYENSGTNKVKVCDAISERSHLNQRYFIWIHIYSYYYMGLRFSGKRVKYSYCGYILADFTEYHQSSQLSKIRLMILRKIWVRSFVRIISESFWLSKVLHVSFQFNVLNSHRYLSKWFKNRKRIILNTLFEGSLI